jgi:hypothetical protein
MASNPDIPQNHRQYCMGDISKGVTNTHLAVKKIYKKLKKLKLHKIHQGYNASGKQCENAFLLSTGKHKRQEEISTTVIQ